MNTLRPDERASLAQQQRNKEFESNIGKGIKTAANIGLSAAGIGAVGKVLPFLSQHIPLDLAMKGINKVSPQLGGFLKRGMEMGLDPQEGLNFIKEKLSPAKQNEQKNIIERTSPELHQFISQEIQKGLTPLQAGAKASVDKKFMDVIKKITKDNKVPWSNLLESVYGASEAPQQQQNQPMEQQQQDGNQDLIAAMQRILQM